MRSGRTQDSCYTRPPAHSSRLPCVDQLRAHSSEGRVVQPDLVYGRSAQPAPASGPLNVLIRPSMITVSTKWTIAGSRVMRWTPVRALTLASTTLICRFTKCVAMPTQCSSAGRRWGRISPRQLRSFGPRFEMGGYQLDFEPTNFNVGSHHIYGYAVSAINRAGNGRGYGFRHRAIAAPERPRRGVNTLGRPFCTRAREVFTVRLDGALIGVFISVFRVRQPRL